MHGLSITSFCHIFIWVGIFFIVLLEHDVLLTFYINFIVKVENIGLFSINILYMNLFQFVYINQLLYIDHDMSIFFMYYKYIKLVYNQ